MNSILSKFGVTSKSVLHLSKVTIYTLDYYDVVNLHLPLCSVTFSMLTCLKTISFISLSVQHVCVGSWQDSNGRVSLILL